MIKVFEMFAGYGGASFALKKAGIEYETVGYSEIDKFAIKCYEQNHRGVINYGDATKIDAGLLPDFDLLTGGFPCQAFSIAGKRGGFEDTRGTLFFEIARIVKVKRPKYLLLENVKGLLNHDKGNTFRIILQTLGELGYEYQFGLVNSRYYGIPQNRERIFIVCNLRGERRPEVFPLRADVQETDGKRTATRTLTGGGHSGGLHSQMTGIIQLNQPIHSNERVYSEDGISPALNTMRGGNRQPFVASAVLTPDRLEKRQNGRRIKNEEEPMFTLNTQDKHGVVIQSHSPRCGDPTDVQKTDEISEEVTISNFSEREFGFRKCSPTLAARDYKDPKIVLDTRKYKGETQPRIYDDISPTLCARARTDESPCVIQSHSPKCGDPTKGGTGLLESDKYCFTLDRSPHYVKQNLMLRYGRDNRSCLRSGRNLEVGFKGQSIRRLTPTECFRLMGFQDGEINLEGISDSQKYKLAGNGWEINIVSLILKEMFKSISSTL